MIISPDKNCLLDGSVVRIAREIQTDIPILPLTRIDNFVFNPELLSLDKYILLDYSELWWNTENENSHLFGKNTNDFSEIYKGDEWLRFDDFVRNQPPAIYFKRELLKKDVSDTVLPIDYPCWVGECPIDSREQYNARPVNVFFYWGRSHEERAKLHGNIWVHSSKNGASVCDNLYYFSKFLEEEKGNNKWVTLHVPHYGRTDIENILAINGLSKLSISLFGAGRKCFRTTGESPVNSLMVMQDSKSAYSYEWIHGENCLKFPTTQTEIEMIDEFLQRKDLYDIYVEGVKTCDKYKISNYLNNYINPIINSI